MKPRNITHSLTKREMSIIAVHWSIVIFYGIYMFLPKTRASSRRKYLMASDYALINKLIFKYM